MAKRRGPAGSGSVYKRAVDGRWYAVAELGTDSATGRRIRKAFAADTQRQAVSARTAWLRQRQIDLADGLADPLDRNRREPYTVAKWLAYWLEHVVKPQREPTTLDNYANTIRLHVVPGVGRYLLDRLTTEHVEAWLQDMERAGTGARTRQVALQRLKTALAEAVTRKHQTGVRHNAAEPVVMPTNRRKRIEAPEVADTRKLLAAAEGERLEALVTVLLGLGLRRGEALGLRWGDIDLEAGIVHIRRRVSHINHQGTFAREGTKAHPEQAWTLVMPAMVTDALRQHRERQKRERLPNGWVFCRASGDMLSPSSAETFWKRVRARAGLPKKSMHSLRHDCASFLLDQGVPLEVVSQILRHANVRITADVYAHLTPRLFEAAAKAMDNVFRAETGSLG